MVLMWWSGSHVALTLCTPWLARKTAGEEIYLMVIHRIALLIASAAYCLVAPWIADAADAIVVMMTHEPIFGAECFCARVWDRRCNDVWP